MRISDYYKLKRTQPNLDFVDVDINRDLPVFIDPHAIRFMDSAWTQECVANIQNYFKTVLDAIHDGNKAHAIRLLNVLREPNETHLGLSRGVSQGKALGPISSQSVWESLSHSEAVKSGLLEDLEDTILMIYGISSDIVSDITTNIIRGSLIKYTQQMADYYEIPLIDGVYPGPIWDSLNKQWLTLLTRLPIAENKKLLLVPKMIVRRRMEYNVDDYYTNYLLDQLRVNELNANTELVHLLKNGVRRVTSKDLKAKYGTGKSAIVRLTMENPEVLARYRNDMKAIVNPPLDHSEFSDVESTALPDWEELLRNVISIVPGNKEAIAYEKAIEAFFTTIFYPSLTNPIAQVKIHKGRKRIDISYTNIASNGFFKWLSMHFPSPNIFIECKNYSGEIGNPELDQLSGRFSPSRGTVGILVCRSFDDKNLFLERCRDTAIDQRGYIIVLDDSDLKALVVDREKTSGNQDFSLIKNQFDNLIN